MGKEEIAYKKDYMLKGKDIVLCQFFQEKNCKKQHEVQIDGSRSTCTVHRQIRKGKIVFNIIFPVSFFF